MAKYWKVCLLGVTFIWLPEVQAQDQGKEKITAALKAWKEQAAQVQSVRCEATVRSFFPKGYLTNTAPFSSESTKELPEANVNFSGESAKWLFEFSKPRVRKERGYTVPWHSEPDGNCAFVFDRLLSCYTPGKLQFRRDPEGHSKLPSDPGRSGHDATIYQDTGSVFLLDRDDLPLLWLGGGVNGDQSVPANMTLTVPPEAISYRGVTAHQGKSCWLFSLAEQKQADMFRELTVEQSPPHAIVRCIIRRPGKIYTDIQIQYARENNLVVPQEWTLADYYRGRNAIFSTHTYTVKKLEVNPTFSDEEFDPPLSSGLRIFFPEHQVVYEVNSFGQLVPPGEGGVFRSWVFWLLIFGSLILFGFWMLRQFRKTKD